MSVEMNMLLKLEIHFTRTQLEEFLRPISGDGGGQQFVRRCQSIVRQQNTRREPGTGAVLTLLGDDVERWIRYRNEYGDGGFQRRLGRTPEQASLL